MATTPTAITTSGSATTSWASDPHHRSGPPALGDVHSFPS